jgi:hypothetical protein
MLEILKNNWRAKNPFLIFFPFLLLYVFIVLLFPTYGNTGDESKYLNLANNLINGFYSAPAPNVNLPEGPGYPILLIPFISFGLPLISITLLNAFFYYFSIIFLYKSLKRITRNYLIPILFSIFWGLYYNLYEVLPSIITETFTILLITLIIYFSVLVFEPGNWKNKNKYLILAGFFLGYLALTKLIFGYVLAVLFIGTGILWIFNRKRTNLSKSMIILSVAFITLSPYLVYTYQLTGKLFYLGTSGGGNLYWMTALPEKEYGSWFGNINTAEDSNFTLKTSGNPKFENQLFSKQRDYKITGFRDSLKFYHMKDFNEINKYTGVEMDNAFKKIAIKNIKANPIKFLKNCFANLGRIFFNYPYSYEMQKPGTLIRFPFPGIILVLLSFALIPTFINWKKIVYPVRFIILFIFIYLGGSIIGSAEIRMFTMIVPAIIFWLAYILENTVKINFRFAEKSE